MENPSSPLDTLRQLKEMLDSGALTPTEFEALKQRLVFSPPPAMAAEPAPPTAGGPPLLPPVDAPVPQEPGAPVVPVVPAAPEAAPREWTAPGSAARPDSRPPSAGVTTGFQTPDQPAEYPEPEPRNATPEAASETDLPDLPAARSSSLGLVLAIAGVLVFLAVVAYLGFNRPPSEHLSSTSQTAADSLSSPIETGPQVAPLPAPAAEPETVRLAPAHPAPALPTRAEIEARAAAARDSVERAASPAETDSAVSQ